MFAMVDSLGVSGLDGFMVRVETDISGGLPNFDIVGLPDNAVKEAKERVRSAIKNSGFTYPVSRITVNLAPADVRKTGAVYDLPVFLSVLCATEQLKLPLEKLCFAGELGLNGEIRTVNGILPMAIAAKENGFDGFFVPEENAAEAAIVEGLTVYPCKNVLQVVAHFKTDEKITPSPKTDFEITPLENALDFSDVHGQLEARRALEIAASGGHNVLMIGPPGAGKSMLAKRMASILPPLSRDEAMEVTKIYSVVGMLQGKGLVGTRPFRSPHHSVSAPGLSGGGSVPRPGEISLAHNGVLFLDELPEFRRDALEILRQPLEDGILTVSRASASITFPCKLMLVAAMNPCPCGYFGHPTKECTCSQNAIERYLQKISGPLLDRIDLHVEVAPVDYEDISAKKGGECSSDILKRVLKARSIQSARFAGTDVNCNAQIPSGMLREVCVCSEKAQQMLKGAFEKLGLSARGYDRILKVSRTIADLEESENIEAQHIAEALQYRNLDKKYWQI